MLNKTLIAHKNEYNHFTRALRKKCLQGKPVLVRMRNNDWCEAVFSPANANECMKDDLFKSVDNSKCWTANGESITDNAFDIIEFK